MAIEGLTIIGESINDSLFDPRAAGALERLAVEQDEGGASYIDVSLDSHPPALMAEAVRRIQAVTRRPLSIDTSDPEIAEAGLRAYDPDRAGGRAPILNSVSLLRLGMLDLCEVRPFTPILMASELVEDGRPARCRTPEDTLRAAGELLAAATARLGVPAGRCILDPAVTPLACDTDGSLRGLVGAIGLIGALGAGVVVGLSNLTAGLPPRRADGSPVRGPLESALLTLAMPLGLNTIVGSVRREYELLPAGHPAVRCLTEALGLEGFDVVRRVREFYAGP